LGKASLRREEKDCRPSIKWRLTEGGGEKGKAEPFRGKKAKRRSAQAKGKDDAKASADSPDRAARGRRGGIAVFAQKGKAVAGEGKKNALAKPVACPAPDWRRGREGGSRSFPRQKGLIVWARGGKKRKERTRKSEASLATKGGGGGAGLASRKKKAHVHMRMAGRGGGGTPPSQKTVPTTAEKKEGAPPGVDVKLPVERKKGGISLRRKGGREKKGGGVSSRAAKGGSAACDKKR